MILIDSNSLVVLILGLIDPELINTHKKTSIYDEEDFYKLLGLIENFENLIFLPNIWTEVDNLLNNFSGERKYLYVKKITELIKTSTEQYLQSELATQENYFISLGITDSLIIKLGKECKILITSDSQLSDYAIANGIEVYDMKKVKNNGFR